MVLLWFITVTPCFVRFYVWECNNLDSLWLFWRHTLLGKSSTLDSPRVLCLVPFLKVSQYFFPIWWCGSLTVSIPDHCLFRFTLTLFLWHDKSLTENKQLSSLVLGVTIKIALNMVWDEHFICSFLRLQNKKHDEYTAIFVWVRTVQLLPSRNITPSLVKMWQLSDLFYSDKYSFFICLSTSPLYLQVNFTCWTSVWGIYWLTDSSTLTVAQCNQ